MFPVSIHIHNSIDTHQADFSELAKVSADATDDDEEDGDSVGESVSDDEDDPMN
jgi:hypothetical protein